MAGCMAARGMEATPLAASHPISRGNEIVATVAIAPRTGVARGNICEVKVVRLDMLRRTTTIRKKADGTTMTCSPWKQASAALADS